MIIGRALRNVERSLLLPNIKKLIQLNNGLGFLLKKKKKSEREKEKEEA